MILVDEPPSTLENKKLQQNITSAIYSLEQKLRGLNLTQLRISEYNQRYLLQKFNNLDGELLRYGRLLYLSMHNQPVDAKNFCLVDYGGGSGLISLLAAEMGVGNVIYNDIYDVSCEDVKKISAALNMNIHHFVCGDVDQLLGYLKQNNLHPNSITSYDVLEHIYNVDYHLDKLSSLQHPSFRIVYGSGANIENPLYCYLAAKQQRMYENKTREKKWGQKERDSLKAYVDIRKEIIQSHCPSISDETALHLARLTRGLMKADIEKAADEFLASGKISYKNPHPTNTCDPLNGNWAEHLMPFSYIEETAKKHGFAPQILKGYFSVSGNFSVKSVKLSLNMCNGLLGRRGMMLAPYYVLLAEREK